MVHDLATSFSNIKKYYADASTTDNITGKHHIIIFKKMNPCKTLVLTRVPCELSDNGHPQ